MNNYNYLDLFSGIGGFALGAYWAGMKFRNHFCSDIESYPVELYQKRFPGSIQLGDITEIDFEKLKKDYPGEWIITGGFPCQDISIAGKGKGLIDGETGEKTRSGLWFNYWRAIRILQPRFAIIENVGMLVKRGLATVLSNIAEIGYNVEWQDIRAEDMDAPHRRERIWIVAYPGYRDRGMQNQSGNGFNKEGKSIKETSKASESGEGPKILANSNNSGKRTSYRGIDKDRQKENREVKPQSEPCGHGKNDLANSKLRGCIHGQIEEQSAKTWESAQCDIGSESEMADTNIEGLQGRNSKILRECSCKRIIGKSSTLSDSKRGGLEKRKTKKAIQHDVECSYMQTRKTRQADSWDIEPDVGRLAHGIPRRVDRLKGLGNAIVPQIAKLLFNQIKPYL